MGLVHGRELLIQPLRAPLVPLVAAVALGCADGARNPDPAGRAGAPDSLPAAAPSPEATLVGHLPEGGPMPAAENAAGIPPYPSAKVHTSRQQTSQMRSFEAFTPDEWERVVAHFDSHLGPPAWSRIQAEDMVIYEKEGDEASITVSPWEPREVRAGAPEFMLDARTAIGAAWRPTASR